MPPGRPTRHHRSAALAAILPPGSVIGYDALVAVGLARFVHDPQRDETRARLIREHGVTLSTGESSHLAHRFLVYLEAIDRRRRPGTPRRAGRSGRVVEVRVGELFRNQDSEYGM
jgi:hypothetical protein